MGKFSFGEKLKKLFSSESIDSSFYDDLTDLLVEGDVGAKLSFEITDRLEKICKEKKVSSKEGVLDELELILSGFLTSGSLEFDCAKTNIVMLMVLEKLLLLQNLLLFLKKAVVMWCWRLRILAGRLLKNSWKCMVRIWE